MENTNREILKCEDRMVESIEVEKPTVFEEDNLLNFYEGKFNSDNINLGQAIVEYNVDLEGTFVNKPTDVKFTFRYTDLDNNVNTISTIVNYEFNPLEFVDYSLRLREQYIELLHLTVSDIFNKTLEESTGNKNA